MRKSDILVSSNFQELVKVVGQSFNMKLIQKLKHFLLFSPFLAFYCYYTVKRKLPVFFGDELRYYNFAHHIVNGFYSPPAPDINLWNGPGYPLVLAPFVALKAPLIVLYLLNALFFYLSVVFLYKTLTRFLSEKKSFLFSVFWALYINLFQFLPALLSESLTCLLVVLFCYQCVRAFTEKQSKNFIFAAFFLGYLTLTKIIFGYVLILGLLGSGIMLVTPWRNALHYRSLLIFGCALLFNLPYLIYTWSLTGKYFYWGNSGGMSFYWMTSPYNDEFGDWKLAELHNINLHPFKSPASDSILKAGHTEDMKLITQHTGVVQDELYKKLAIANIKKYPKKYLRNCFYNISRIFFNYPYSYEFENAEGITNIIFGSLVLWASVLCIIPTWSNRRKIPASVILLLLTTLIYLSLSTMVSAYSRQLDVVVPVFIIWIALVFDRYFHVKLNNSHSV